MTSSRNKQYNGTLSQIDSIFTGEENIQFVTGQEKNLAIKDIWSESQNFDFLNYIDTEIQTIESNEVKNSIESEKNMKLLLHSFLVRPKSELSLDFTILVLQVSFLGYSL